MSDRNTSFFHTQTIGRRKCNKIHGLQLDDGSWITEETDLCNKALRFYQNLFCGNENVNLHVMEIQNHPTISREVAATLLAPVLKEDVRVAIMSMSSFTAPRSIGFQLFFFKHYWSLIGDDLWRMVQNAFNSGFFNP